MQPTIGRQWFDFYHHRLVLPIILFHINGLSGMCSFISGSFHLTVFLNSIKAVMYMNGSFILLLSIMLYHLLLHLLVDGHLGCFQCLAIMNKATMSILIQKNKMNQDTYQKKKKEYSNLDYICM